MGENSPETLSSWFTRRADEEKEILSSFEQNEGGIETLQDLAREANQLLQPNPSEWARFLSHVFLEGGRMQILFGIYGLGRSAASLDDLFGERLGGISRELKDRTIADELANVVGWWVLDDLSRIGYLEAWAVRGENIWKRRLSAISTIRFNKEGHSLPAESFRVLRHLMTCSEPELIEATSKAIRHVQDVEQVERFLAWWAPRMDRELLEKSVQSLGAESRERLLALA